MDRSEKLTVDDAVTLLRAFAANKWWGKLVVSFEEGRVIHLSPRPGIKTASQLRSVLPERKQ